MRIALLCLALALLFAAPSALAQQKPAPATPPSAPGEVPLHAITALPANYPTDVPLPQGLKAVAAGERHGALIVLFQGGGKAEPLRAAYEAELAKRGWKIEGTDKEGDEQGLFAVHGERTLSLLFAELGPELRMQLAYVPKTPKAPPTAK